MLRQTLSRTTIALVIVWMTTGCQTTMKATKLDAETGRFSTSSKLAHNAVRVQQPFDPKYRALLYVNTDGKSEVHDKFFIDSFKNMKGFTAVMTKTELEALVFERGLTGKVSGISDRIGLNSLSKEIGPFLIVEPRTEWKGGHNYEAELTAIDPTTGAVVLQLHNSAFNWWGLDQPLFFPLFNAFLDWSEGKPIDLHPVPEPRKDKKRR